jgi:hypothetical protein
MNVDGEGHVNIYSRVETAGGAGSDFLKYQAELTKKRVSSNMCVYTRHNTPVILNIFVCRNCGGGWERFP